MTDLPASPAVITLGECLASFVACQRGSLAEVSDLRLTVAGAEANVAVGVERLGHHAAYIGRVGPDGLGTMIVRRLRGEGVDVRRLIVDATAATGVMIRELRDLGPAEVVYWRAGSAGSRLASSDVDAAEALFAGARWLHLTGITPALSSSAADAVEAALAHARSAGLTVSLDLNLRRRLWSERAAQPVLASLAARCDVVLGGLDEMAVVAGLAGTLEDGRATDPEVVADAVLEVGSGRVVIKLGSEGALERRREDGAARTTRSGATAVAQVADPVGAGDAFCAGYIAASLEGFDPESALRLANACGAVAVSTVGDQTGLPTRIEVERILAAGGPDTIR